LFALRNRADHPIQVGCRIFDVVMLVLSGPAFCPKHPVTMDIIEIAVRRFVPSFGLLIGYEASTPSHDEHAIQ
jgi:hypothetical protein